jgi:hypothetical protein
MGGTVTLPPRQSAGLLWALRAIWKARANITREEIERIADQLEIEDRGLLEQEPGTKP